ERPPQQPTRRQSIRSRGKAADSCSTFRDSATSRGMTRRRRARLFFKQQLASAVRSFHDGLDERDAEFAFFKFEDAIDSTPRRSSHSIFEKGRVIAGFQYDA